MPSHNISKKPDTAEKITSQIDDMKKIKDSNSIDSHKYDFKCHQCEFTCQKKGTLLKHTDTKHGDQTEHKVSGSKCSIYDDEFETKAELKKPTKKNI